MVLVRLLGPVDVIDSQGGVRPPGSALRRTLLALMAMHAGEVLTADWLIEHAWSGQPPDSGLRALRFHISHLRKELGDSELVETRPGGYRLAVSADQVDAGAAEQRARAARDEPDEGAAAEMYADALAMWRGIPFADAAPCSVLDDEAARLEEVRLTITEDCFHARLDAGAGRELVADLARAVARNPLRESLWSMLITAQYRAGLQADALRNYEEMRVMLADALGLDPSTELQDLQRRILQHDPSLVSHVSQGSESEATAPPRHNHNLSMPATALIDSDDRLGFVKRLVQDHRLVTLTGTGGVGKTRLALEVGWSCLDRFGGGVWMVELAPVASADAVVAAFSSALSVRPQQGSTDVESIVDWFHGRELLVIVDNCEHVIDAVRELLTVIVARCPTVKIVVTSREPLGVAGERVSPLAVLDPTLDGVALFLDRASAADSSFALADEQDVVADICRRLDGLPLAIELAAARVRSMAPVDILARLDDRLSLLYAGSGQGLGRHETVWATVEWSYQLLTDRERSVFDRLSVFAGGFDLQAAETVCGGGKVGVQEVVDLVSKLVDKSMVVVERHSTGARYRVLEPVRQFGEERLGNDATCAEVRDRHLRHYVDVAERADTLFRSSRQLVGAAIFEKEWANLRRALDRAVVTGNMDLAERLIDASFHHAESLNRFEHGEWVERVVALDVPDRRASPGMFGMGAYWAFMAENAPRCNDLLTRGLELAAPLDTAGAAFCLAMAGPEPFPSLPDPSARLEVVAATLDLDREWWLLGFMADQHVIRDPDVRSFYLDRLVETAERVRVPTLMVDAAMHLGHRSINQRPPEYSVALGRYRQALETARQHGLPVFEGDCLRAVALATVGLNPEKAIEACRRALIKVYEIRYWHQLWRVLESSALSLASTGHLEAAAVVIGHLEPKCLPVGYEELLGFRDRTREIIRSHAQFEQWKARGAAMDRYRIVDFALAALHESVGQHSWLVP